MNLNMVPLVSKGFLAEILWFEKRNIKLLGIVIAVCTTFAKKQCLREFSHLIHNRRVRDINTFMFTEHLQPPRTTKRCKKIVTVRK